MNFKDYYKILGVAKDSGEDDVKKAYRNLAKQWHPDKNPGDTKAEEKFKEISEAYDVLSDIAKRKKFDDFITLKQSSKAYTYKTRTDYKNTTPESEFSDFFNQFFKNKRGKKKYSYFKGDDLRGKISIDLAEAYAGSIRVVNTEGGKFRIKIKPGVENEKILKIPGKGKISRYGGEPGDLYIRIVLNSHPEFIRKENDLIKTEYIDIYTAILGGEITISTFKGQVKVKIPENFNFKKKIRIKEHGMPFYDNPIKFGDLFLDLKFKLPEKLSDEERSLLRKLQINRKKD